MANHRSSPRVYPIREGVPTKWPAPVEEFSTLLGATSMFVAVTASLGAKGVSALLRGLAREESLVAPVAEMCSACRKEREKQKKAPRSLVNLPSEITQDKLFKRKGLPIRLCAHCDGDALEAALLEHDKRND